MEGGPVAGGFAGAAVDHQVGRALGDVRVEVVHEHAQGGFLLPSPAAQGCAARGADDWGHGFMVARGGSASRCLAAGGVVPEGAAICPFLLPGLATQSRAVAAWRYNSGMCEKCDELQLAVEHKQRAAANASPTSPRICPNAFAPAGIWIRLGFATMEAVTHIHIKGAREHNLKNLDLRKSVV